MTSPPSSSSPPTSPIPGLTSLLIANRGEIAARIARTAERLGIAVVSIGVAGDEGALRIEGRCHEVPGYLDVDAVVAVAVETGVDAVHPGYGFLSERSAFARALERAGILLVGPTASVMEQMGRKDHARDIAIAAGVPVVPTGVPTDPAAYPVLVKAAAGGGGKGMRVVRTALEMDDAVAAARREALAAFGDDTMLVERYVERGRHIEVQVLGDTHGTVVHLGDRDCSAQRRHQKVLEEAPAPTLDDATRARIRQAGVDLAAQVGYTGAGTVEFLLDPVEMGGTGDFYFLEMNTRLQVEHPVTEAVARVGGEPVDLVELQLRVAAGEPLGFTQDDVTMVGHAIEARVYAEDAFGGFLPQAGRTSAVRWPTGTGVRVDEALASGQTVSTAYDPMLGKVIVSGSDREEARTGLVRALDDTVILGLTTNAGFLRELAAGAAFRDAEITTAWLDEHPLEPPTDEAARALAGLLLQEELDDAPRGAWQPDGFRAGGLRGLLFEHGRDLTPYGWSYRPGRRADPAGGPVRVSTFAHGDGWVLRGRHGTEVAWHGQRFVLAEPDPAGEGATAGDGAVLAPMPGTVLDVRVGVGDQVAADQVLGVLEAMKMELTVRAPHAGTVTSVGATAGTQVPIHAPLFVVESA